ncbi:MAG: glycoside hydrolase family 9 protein [Armatimonadetes bacterium]|nr:glycoside hydrolase family 9 protein [Armatimonadota bacterium]
MSRDSSSGGYRLSRSQITGGTTRVSGRPRARRRHLPGRRVALGAATLLLLAAAVAFQAQRGSGAEVIRPVTPQSPIRVWVDQIGYRTRARKIAIVASDQPLPHPLALEAQNVDTREVVWRTADHANAVRPFGKGGRDAESGEYVAHLDFTDLQTPGRYAVVVRAGGKAERSYRFRIAGDVYRDSSLAAWKAFYFQRADTAKPEKHAGPWSHGIPHRGPDQATQARVYRWAGGKWWDPVGTVVLDPTPRDVTGGWWDAGDFNKYIGNTTLCHNDLLLGIQLLGGAPRDGDLNIPESGNGVPDILDEARWGTEFLIRLADERGAAFGRVHERGASPPEEDAHPVQLTRPTSGATMNRAAALAYAGVVWEEKGLDPGFSGRCFAESMRSWKLLKARPHPWPADPRNPKKQAYTGEWFLADYQRTRALAAACYFRLTADPQYDAIIHQTFERLQALRPGEDTDLYPTIWVYAHTEWADAALVRRMERMIFDAAERVVKQTGEHRGYAAGIPAYTWGSNRLIGQSGVNCLLAAELTEDPAARRRYLDAAEEFVHYLHGRNPLGLCFLSNMKAFGAENSVTVMYHRWVGNIEDPDSARFIGVGRGKVGPYPGAVVGGANGGMKRYVNNLDWRLKCWEYNEPDITYQSPCATLLAYFGLKGL